MYFTLGGDGTDITLFTFSLIRKHFSHVLAYANSTNNLTYIFFFKVSISTFLHENPRKRSVTKEKTTPNST